MEFPSTTPAELVRACAESRDPHAWEEFVRRFQPLIAAVALRTCRRWGEFSPQVVDDLVQETFLKLCAEQCRLLRDFKPEHPDSFLGYLKVLTTNLVHDHFKARSSAKRGLGRAAESLETAGPAVAPAPELERGILIQEIKSCLERVAPGAESVRDRRIFWLYYRQGLTAQAIALLPSIGLTTKGVESVILRLTRLLRAELASRRAGQPPKGLQAAESL
jgi:RNA polymerase sigma-70 factor (ECF subfamily)